MLELARFGRRRRLSSIAALSGVDGGHLRADPRLIGVLRRLSKLRLGLGLQQSVLCRPKQGLDSVPFELPLGLEPRPPIRCSPLLRRRHPQPGAEHCEDGSHRGPEDEARRHEKILAQGVADMGEERRKRAMDRQRETSEEGREIATA